MAINKIKGTFDIYGEQMKKYHEFERAVYNVAKLYNYQEIRTPIFEQTDLFHRSVGEETDMVSKETYDFVDRGKRQITLRPEGTAGVVRSFIENKMYANMSSPCKVYYQGPMFRYERPQKGRTRQFHQFGVEAFGSYSPLMDAEVIDFSVTVLKALKIENVVVHINTLGDDETKKRYEKALVEHFTPYIDTMCQDCQKRIVKNPLRVLDCKVDSDTPQMKSAPNIIDYLSEQSKKHFDKVCHYLDTMNIPYVIDSKLVRGLDYYTDTVFELQANLPSLGAQNVVGGGGRYNNLVKSLGGPDVGAVGFAFGIERLLFALDSFAEQPKPDSIHLYIMALGEKAKEYVATLTNTCRLNGLITDTDYFEKSFKAQFKLASKLNAKFVAILGDEEIDNGTINVKNQITQDQITIPMDKLVEYVRNQLLNPSGCSGSCSSCSEGE